MAREPNDLRAKLFDIDENFSTNMKKAMNHRTVTLKSTGNNQPKFLIRLFAEKSKFSELKFTPARVYENFNKIGTRGTMASVKIQLIKLILAVTPINRLPDALTVPLRGVYANIPLRPV